MAREQLDRLVGDGERQAMRRVIARLEVFLAQTMANLGDTWASYRWWASARRTADASADADTRVWARSQEVNGSLYNQRPLAAVFDLADEAIGLSHRPRMGTAKALAGRAQALALQGRTGEALAGIEATERAFDESPASVTGDIDTMYGWPEYQLRFCQSSIYTYLDDAMRAAQAQERALALCPEHMFRERAGVQLHRALRLVRSGDVAGGAIHAQQVMTDLPEAHRVGNVLQLARFVVQAVPRATQSHAEVAGLRELLAVPAAPSHA